MLISAGFDAHADDPLGEMQVSSKQFARMTSVVKRIADESCQGRLVSVLEGGYGLKGLAEASETHLRTLLD